MTRSLNKQLLTILLAQFNITEDEFHKDVNNIPEIFSYDNALATIEMSNPIVEYV